MSACISRHGEYSEHELDEHFVCRLCGALDEEAVSAALADANELLDKIDTWAFEEAHDGFTEAVSPDYREGFRDACEAVRGLIQANREPEVKP